MSCNRRNSSSSCRRRRRRSGSMMNIRMMMVVVVSMMMVMMMVWICLIHKKAHQQKPKALCNALSTMTQFARKDQGMSSLDMYSRIQGFKVRSATFVIQSTSITQGNQKGPFRFVRMHIQFLPFLLGHIILDNMRLSVVQLQGPLEMIPNGMRHTMHRFPTSVCQCRKFSTTQRLFGIRIGRIMSLADLFRRLYQRITFRMR
mmetsp:Transcript_18490/g.42805  ORF Transcript_18490/g.42805 Transcript_18490/m.42805 type:complete len:202 (-) Transcript_18490:715-1320(-)